MKRIASLLAVTSLSAFWAGHAAAAYIEVDYQGFASGYVAGKIRGVENVNVRAGMFEFDVEDDPSGVYWNSTLQAFCIDVEHLLKDDDSKYWFRTADQRLNSLQLSLIGQLYDSHASELGTGSQIDAAFQLALWEIIYDYAHDDGLSLYTDSGDFWAIDFGAARTDAQAWLGALSQVDDYVSSSFEFFVLEPKRPWDNQALLVWRERVQVPEPGTLALLGIGLLAFAPRLAASRRPRRLRAGRVA